jgi:phosphohistidine phosphatase
VAAQEATQGTARGGRRALVTERVFLYLVHHGDAVSPAIDPQRPLSAAGEAAVRRLAEEAAARQVEPAAIWHSGKLRARQTAHAFWQSCNPLAEFAAVRGLQPTDPPEWIVDRIAIESRDVMLAGHLPSLARILGRLLRAPAENETDFPPHGMVAVEREGDHWVERWRLV